eukprot:2889654-Prymnesium_polylepis.1
MLVLPSARGHRAVYIGQRGTLVCAYPDGYTPFEVKFEDDTQTMSFKEDEVKSEGQVSGVTEAQEQQERVRRRRRELLERRCAGLPHA